MRTQKTDAAVSRKVSSQRQVKPLYMPDVSASARGSPHAAGGYEYGSTSQDWKLTLSQGVLPHLCIKGTSLLFSIEGVTELAVVEERAVTTMWADF